MDQFSIEELDSMTNPNAIKDAQPSGQDEAPKKVSITVPTPFGPLTLEGEVVHRKTYADGIAQGRREAADAIRLHMHRQSWIDSEPGLESDIEELCGVILGTASDEKTDKGEPKP
jgi:hypothetical protein